MSIPVVLRSRLPSCAATAVVRRRRLSPPQLSSPLRRFRGEPTARAARTRHVKTPPVVDQVFDKLVTTNFPGALNNKELATRVVGLLEEKGFTPENTLLATSVCADELARELEDEFVNVYGTNFNLGGLSGFPFAGNTGWGAMCAHVPDDGCPML